MRKGIWIYVWKDAPSDGALQTFTGALVRAANGNNVTAPEGFSFANNYARWVAKFGKDQVQPWTYLYPSSNGTTAANALHSVAGDRQVYQCDLEDAVPPATIRAFCDRLHALVPGCLVVFDSYPTRRQFVNVNGTAGAATWDQAVKSFDVFCPQVYYSSQRDDGWENEFGGKPIWPAFSPANWGDFAYFQAKLDRFGVTNLWRFPYTDGWKGRLTYKEVDDVSMEDVINALKSDDGQKYLRSAALLGSQDTLRTAVAGAKDRAAGPYFSSLAADVNNVKAAVGDLSDDEANLLTAFNTGQAALLQAIQGLAVGDPTAIQTIVEEIRKQPAETVAAIKEAL